MFLDFRRMCTYSSCAYFLDKIAICVPGEPWAVGRGPCHNRLEPNPILSVITEIVFQNRIFYEEVKQRRYCFVILRGGFSFILIRSLMEYNKRVISFHFMFDQVDGKSFFISMQLFCLACSIYFFENFAPYFFLWKFVVCHTLQFQSQNYSSH